MYLRKLLQVVGQQVVLCSLFKSKWQLEMVASLMDMLVLMVLLMAQSRLRSH